MGIYKLNTFLKYYCPNSIKEQDISELKNKKIAVDISVYLYRFKKLNKMIIELFNLCSMFREYNIHPIFIYDGITPENKKESVKHRKKVRKQYKKEYNELLKTSKLDEDHISLNKRKKYLESQLVKLKNIDFENSKQLLNLYGMNYIVANGEADELCAYLSRFNYVDAIMSDDTDMFAYGCKTILRYTSIINKTVISCNIHDIYKELDVTEAQFRWLCSISSNDYHNPDMSDDSILTFEENYKNSKHSTKEYRQNIIYSFYNNTKYENITNNIIIPYIFNKKYDIQILMHYLYIFYIFII